MDISLFAARSIDFAVCKQIFHNFLLLSLCYSSFSPNPFAHLLINVLWQSFIICHSDNNKKSARARGNPSQKNGKDMMIAFTYISDKSVSMEPHIEIILAHGAVHVLENFVFGLWYPIVCVCVFATDI